MGAGPTITNMGTRGIVSNTPNVSSANSYHTPTGEREAPWARTGASSGRGDQAGERVAAHLTVNPFTIDCKGVYSRA